MSVCTVVDVPSLGESGLDQERGLSQRGFRRLLDWLDGGVDSKGQTYLETRRRLTSYFDRRGRPFADDLADETFFRITQTLERDGSIAVTPQARYCYVVARFVLLEDIRREQRQQRHNQSTRAASAGTGGWNGQRAELLQADSGVALERRLERLDHCLQQLTPEQRDLIVEYYSDTGQGKIARRRDMAKWLGISVNALCLRASRIRAALESQMDDALPTVP